METPLLEERVKNVSGRESCRWCGDAAWVPVATRRDPVIRVVVETREDGSAARAVQLVGEAETEEMGPCPFCERGWFLEFGDLESQTKTPPVLPPWDTRNGFWFERDADIAPLYSLESDLLPLTAIENARRARELLAGLVLQDGVS